MNKIDEDLIFESIEKVRDKLVKYAIGNLTKEELQTIIDIFPNPKGLIAEMKIEQTNRYDERSEFLSKLELYGLTEEEFGQSCNDYFADMRSAMY